MKLWQVVAVCCMVFYGCSEGVDISSQHGVSSHQRAYIYSSAKSSSTGVTSGSTASASPSYAGGNEPSYIFGIHDPGGEYLMAEKGKKGWVLITEELRNYDPATGRGGDYSGLYNEGFGVIVRLNWGYHPNGTIPYSYQYDIFAEKCADWVKESRGCDIWIIGNEMNKPSERPGGVNGEVITPQMYIDCFKKVRNAIKQATGGAASTEQVVIGAVAPWNNKTNNMYWIDYFKEILYGLQGECDGIAIHTYTHGPEVWRITSEEKPWPQYPDAHFDFRTYQDFMNAIPDSMRNLPVYITETDQDGPWLDEDNGWIQAAYEEINRWNSTPGNQKIRCLLLYRWRGDRYEFYNKGQVHKMFRSAMDNDYRWKDGSSGVVVLNAQFLSQNVPTTMVAGRQYTVRITMRNTGTVTWSNDVAGHEFKLGSWCPQDTVLWGFNRVWLDDGERILPGGEKEFVFTVTAPDTPGKYDFRWRMVQEWVQWFGEPTPNVVVDVVSPNTPPPSSALSLSKLSIQTEFVHGGAESWRFLHSCKPRVVKINNAFGDNPRLIKELSPNTIIIGRFVTDHQPMDGDPKQRAREWWERHKDTILSQPHVDYWEGYNEPIGGGIDVDGMRWYAEFEAERVRILAQHGKKACIGNFATGCPEVNERNGVKMWELFYPAIDAALQHGGVLGLHEYGAPWMNIWFEDDKKEGWLCGRYRKVYNWYLKPTNRVIPLVITECGIDGDVCANNTGISGGWRNFTDWWRKNGGNPDGPTEYMRQLAWYDNLLREDDYVIGATIFCIDLYGWESFDLSGEMLTKLIEHLNAAVGAPSPPTPPSGPVDWIRTEGDGTATVYGPYFYPRSVLGSEAAFLYGGRGAAMQGTSFDDVTKEFVKYRGGGGYFVRFSDPEWPSVRQKYYAMGITDFTGFYSMALSNPGGASYTRYGADYLIYGAASRPLVENFSCAVDPNMIDISRGEIIYCRTLDRYFRADDTGGAVKGWWIDVFSGYDAIFRGRLDVSIAVIQNEIRLEAEEYHEAKSATKYYEGAMIWGDGSSSRSGWIRFNNIHIPESREYRILVVGVPDWGTYVGWPTLVVEVDGNEVGRVYATSPTAERFQIPPKRRLFEFKVSLSEGNHSITLIMDADNWYHGRSTDDDVNLWLDCIYIVPELGQKSIRTVFRTGWEDGDIRGIPDKVEYLYNVTGWNGNWTPPPECSFRRDEESHTGSCALMVAGRANATYSYCYYRIFDDDITVEKGMKIRYWIYIPNYVGTSQVAIDGHFKDGSTIRDSGLKDQHGILIHPAARQHQRGIWHFVEVDLSPVAGKTIDFLMVGFDNGQNGYTGRYRAYIDDFEIVVEK